MPISRIRFYSSSRRPRCREGRQDQLDRKEPAMVAVEWLQEPTKEELVAPVPP